MERKGKDKKKKEGRVIENCERERNERKTEMKTTREKYKIEK